VLDFIYYPVSWILWFWHKVFGFVFGESNGVSWVLGIIFLVWTLRAILFKPMVNQVRSMRKMQEFAPEMKKVQKKYANDRQRQAQEMQKLQREHGFNPLGGCLPMLLQIPVFIGLFHVLRSFVPGHTENYGFDAQGVQSYVDANLFGARLSNFITQPQVALDQLHADRTSVILVSIPLMILASALTHLTARHSVARQNPDSATSQTAIMNKLTMYIFPMGVLLFGLFFPIGLLFYWLANNFWTLMQQRFVYKKIDAEEAVKKAEAIEKRSNLAPKPGAKPDQTRKKGAAPAPGAKPQPGVKPAPNAKAAGTAKKPASANKPQPGAKPAPNAKAAGTARSKSNGSTQSSSEADNGTAGDSTVSGLSSDRSRKKNTGRKNR
jgi:YidC/Oxa1 family membrane protein insertase